MAKKGGSKKMAASGNSSGDSNLMGALAYILMPLTGILMYFVKPDDKYVRYHSVQAIILGVLLAVIGFLLGMVSVVPVIGIIIGLLAGMGWLFIEFLVWLYCLWKAYSGEKFRIPVISDMVDKNVG